MNLNDEHSDELSKFDGLNNLLMDKQQAVEQSLKYARDLNKVFSDLKSAHNDLKNAYLDTVLRLSLAAEYRDKYTGDHISRISRYGAFLAKKMGMSDNTVQIILFASPMHDVGKIGIPDSILLKKGKLTNEEFEIIKSHCEMGARILSNSKSEVLQAAESIALTHHEKWNGEGYPNGYAKKDIPIEGRIIAFVDVFDALISRRPYKEAFSFSTASGILSQERGVHFDPSIVDLFSDYKEDFEEMSLMK